MSSSVTLSEARQLLTKFREENHRKSEYVVDLWCTVIAKHRNKLGDELWTVYEQVCIAACDCAELDLAKDCLKHLQRQFPKSARVLKLKALIYEASDNFQEAHEIYSKLMDDEPANSLVLKRQVAILKAMRKRTQAIRSLNAYLEKFSADIEAWLELCDLYIDESEYTKAAYCCEEAILSNPRNHLYHQKYAEILYTEGGKDNIENACKYFAQSVKLNENNLRSMYGILMTTAILIQSPKSSNALRNEMSKLNSWTKNKICNTYKNVQAESNDIKELEICLDSLTMAISNEM